MADIYYFKNLPRIGDKIIESTVSIFYWIGNGYSIDYNIKIENFGWIRLPIEDPELDIKLKTKEIKNGDYPLEEFEKLIN